MLLVSLMQGKLADSPRLTKQYLENPEHFYLRTFSKLRLNLEFDR